MSDIAIADAAPPPTNGRRPDRARSIAFDIAFYAWSTPVILLSLPLSLLPGRRWLAGLLNVWARVSTMLLETIAGVKVDIRGREHIPTTASIVAAKHQSAADGIVQTALLKDISFVVMKEIEKFPFVGRLLRRLDMMLVEECGEAARETVRAGGRRAVDEGRPILIYPEGRLMPVGERGRYKLGVWRLYDEFRLPVTPVATNIGLMWPRWERWKFPGTAVIEFLPAIPPGLTKDDFMARLEDAIETRTAALVAEARS